VGFVGCGVSPRDWRLVNQWERGWTDPFVGLGGAGCFSSDFTGVDFTASGFVSVTGGVSGGGRAFNSFAPAVILSLRSWIDLSKINSMVAARWELSPEEELLMVSRSEEPLTEGFNFEWNSLCCICLIGS